jgi:hypothetical protein
LSRQPHFELSLKADGPAFCAKITQQIYLIEKLRRLQQELIQLETGSWSSELAISLFEASHHPGVKGNACIFAQSISALNPG